MYRAFQITSNNVNFVSPPVVGIYPNGIPGNWFIVWLWRGAKRNGSSAPRDHANCNIRPHRCRADDAGYANLFYFIDLRRPNDVLKTVIFGKTHVTRYHHHCIDDKSYIASVMISLAASVFRL